MIGEIAARGNQVLIGRINRRINKKALERKVFCIGLHKTGTTSLGNLASQYGYKTTHSVDWPFDQEKLTKYNFFCDGGSHFDNINEFEFPRLAATYPDSLFVLQTRDTEEWIKSKLVHAGWNLDTRIEPDNPEMIEHSKWCYKSLLTIRKFIEHKTNYERKVVDFFRLAAADRLLVVDITNKDIQGIEIARLAAFLGVKTLIKVKLPHANKTKREKTFSPEVTEFIKEVIADQPAGPRALGS